VIYVMIDGDDIGRKLAKCYLANRVEELREIKNLVDRKTQEISDLLINLGYEVFFCAADGISGVLSADKIDIASLYHDIENIAGDELAFSAGVGKSLRESYVALLYAKSTGKARICDFKSIV
jgi:hypothetical protein